MRRLLVALGKTNFEGAWVDWARGVAAVAMGASFRNIGKALAGCDRLMIAPALMDELAASSTRCPAYWRQR